MKTSGRRGSHKAPVRHRPGRGSPPARGRSPPGPPRVVRPRSTTYEEKTLSCLQTLCDDDTRAVSTYNKTLSRWESTITPPPGKTCTGQLNPRTQ
jgi:hypothetical protein